MARPEKPIDWDRVDALLEAGCIATEISSHFNITNPTLYDRCMKKYGVTFTDYCAEKKKKGDSLLKEVQFQKALSGDNTMLIWLGKNRLKQKENPEDEANHLELYKKFEEMMQEIKSFQQSSASSVDASSLNTSTNTVSTDKNSEFVTG